MFFLEYLQYSKNHKKIEHHDLITENLRFIFNNMTIDNLLPNFNKPIQWSNLNEEIIAKLIDKYETRIDVKKIEILAEYNINITAICKICNKSFCYEVNQ